MSEKSIHTAIDGSLERMNTDYLDLWLLHRDDESLPVDIYIDALNAEVQKGRLRAFGCSNWKESRIEEANAYARENRLLGFSVSSPQFSCLKPKKPIWNGTTCINDKTRGWYVERRFPVFAWSALARGFLWYGTDGYRPNDELESVFKTNENLERLKRMDVLAEKKGVTRAEIALFSVLHQDFPVSALITSRSAEHLVQCMRSADLILTPEEAAYLETTQSERT